jgi:putative membrane protein
MLTVALISTALAAVLHVYIFVLESLTWTSARTRAVFGTTAEEAETTKLLAFNQGFYNLFLAVVTAAGIAAIIMGHKGVGAALVFAGAGSMAAAAAVLLASAPGKARAALTQGILPTVGVVLLGIALAGS